jgi:small-conductance mechanosensitive channel
MASLITMNKELSRFTLAYKQEILKELLESIQDDTNVKDLITKQVETVQEEMTNLEKKFKASSKRQSKETKPKGQPRPMSAYNKFIKKELPEIAKLNPTMDNKTRMAKASEKWKTLTDKDKEFYKNLTF